MWSRATIFRNIDEMSADVSAAMERRVVGVETQLGLERRGLEQYDVWSAPWASAGDDVVAHYCHPRAAKEARTLCVEAGDQGGIGELAVGRHITQ